MRLYEGGTDGNRTSDTRIFSPLLYQLSYGTSVFVAAKIRQKSISTRKNLQNFDIFLFFDLFMVDIQQNNTLFS